MSEGSAELKAKPGGIVVMGVSGCGKTTVGRELAALLGVRFVEGDSLHPRANVEKMAAGIPLTDDDRWPWLDRIRAELAGAAAAGERLVVSCSALKRIYRDHLRGGQAGLVFVFPHGSRETLLERMNHRPGHFMPVSLLDSQLATLEDPTGEEGVIPVSIDGREVEDIIASLRESLPRFGFAVGG